MDNPYFTGPTNSFASPEQERMLDAENDDKVLHDIRDALHIAMNVVRKFQDEGALAQPTVPSNHSEVAQPLDTLVDIVQALDDALMVAANHQDWTREYIDNEAATPRRCPNCGHQIGSDKTLTPSATRNDPAKADGKAGSTIMDDVMDLRNAANNMASLDKQIVSSVHEILGHNIPFPSIKTGSTKDA